jgi:hypothetical protein
MRNRAQATEIYRLSPADKVCHPYLSTGPGSKAFCRAVVHGADRGPATQPTVPVGYAVSGMSRSLTPNRTAPAAPSPPSCPGTTRPPSPAGAPPWWPSCSVPAAATPPAASPSTERPSSTPPQCGCRCSRPWVRDGAAAATTGATFAFAPLLVREAPGPHALESGHVLDIFALRATSRSMWSAASDRRPRAPSRAGARKEVNAACLARNRRLGGVHVSGISAISVGHLTRTPLLSGLSTKAGRLPMVASRHQLPAGGAAPPGPSRPP